MNMKTSTLLLLLTAMGTQTQAQQGKQRKPNIIFIYADDLGIGETGPYGQQKIKTPRLDQLAREGVRFNKFYTSTPVCAPARCMLLTGRHGGHSYIRGNYEMGGFEDAKEGGQMPLPEGTITIGHMLQQAGYKTAAIGKWGLGMQTTTGNPNKQGFDYFYGYLDQKQAHNYYPTHLWENGKVDKLNNNYVFVHKQITADQATDSIFNLFKGKDYAVDEMTKKAAQFITANRSNPFFLYLPYTIPHVSLQVPDSAVRKYIGQFDEQPYLGQQGYIPVKYPKSTYAAMITYLDTQVGIVMDLVKKLGLDDNTIILFSSDNGTTFNGGVDPAYFNSVGNLRGLKMDLYEGGIREPLIARWPGKIPANSTSDVLSVQYDIMATLAAIAGTKAPANDGISLLPALTGNTAAVQQREYLYFEYPEKGGAIAIRTGDWKAIKTGMKKNKNAPWQLYNLATDPGEQQDVAAQHKDMLPRFDAIVAKEHRNAHISEWEFIDNKKD
ncbi:Arylsulfatase A [Chitinophaga jiangningensis]|uniref:Arylsulfatase A n=1 Tax=Chitinophaga jiangningensis TaxID=1419482 RepID=A0A1M7K0V4_9BACT|nr:arylsulfatase [Chitinophaga jiangningensis]SHM58878.1 Arylsulfatase A [Chitinophaga jiangningensis]